jgi:hypothetical protein
MNKACELFGLDINELTNFSSEERCVLIKKRFKRLALITHPDKFAHEGNKASNYTQKFIEITDAYKFLLDDKKYVNETSFLKLFLSSLNIKNNDLIYKLITNPIILKNIEKMENKLTQMELNDVYTFVNKYGNLFNLSDLFLKRFERNVQTIVLNPTVANMIEHDIYKLDHAGIKYYIPLWHDEIMYDISGGILKCICIPELSENITIDENNNIHTRVDVSWCGLIDNEYISFTIGLRDYKKKVNELYIRTNQKFILYKEGIAKMNDEDVYNIDNKGNIIVDLYII